MTQSYINQVFERFSDELSKAEEQAMTLSLRAHLLHEAKRLQETLNALIVQSQLKHPEIFFINTLDHFIGCARLERSDKLRAHCLLLKGEIERIRFENVRNTGVQNSWQSARGESGETVQGIPVCLT